MEKSSLTKSIEERYAPSQEGAKGVTNLHLCYNPEHEMLRCMLKEEKKF